MESKATPARKTQQAATAYQRRNMRRNLNKKNKQRRMSFIRDCFKWIGIVLLIFVLMGLFGGGIIMAIIAAPCVNNINVDPCDYYPLSSDAYLAMLFIGILLPALIGAGTCIFCFSVSR